MIDHISALDLQTQMHTPLKMLLRLRHLRFSSPSKAMAIRKPLVLWAQKITQHERYDPKQQEMYGSISYPWLALADEYAAQGDPQLAEAWLAEPLQWIVLKETAAGEGYFDHLDTILSPSETASKPSHELLKAYLWTLSLGFCGACNQADQEATSRTEIYRQKLQTQLAKEPPRSQQNWLDMHTHPNTETRSPPEKHSNPKKYGTWLYSKMVACIAGTLVATASLIGWMHILSTAAQAQHFFEIGSGP